MTQSPWVTGVTTATQNDRPGLTLQQGPEPAVSRRTDEMVTDANTRQSVVNPTLQRLAEATDAYLTVLRLSLPDIEALGEPAGFLRELMEAALKDTEWGTPASIAFAVRDL